MTEMLERPQVKTAPKPGVYEFVPFEEYRAWPYLNASALSHFLRSPAHYQAYMVGEDDETRAKARGTICHAGIWEPQRFEAQYAIGPKVKLNTKAGKDEWEQFVAVNPGKIHVRGEDGDTMLGCRRSIWAHPEARKLLAAEGPCEVSIVWDDPETGVRCKARVDKLAMPFGFVVDLKTTRDCRRRAFEKSIAEYRIHLQAAHNLAGLARLGIVCDGFAVVAIETEPPYALMVWELDSDCIEKGHRQRRAGIQAYAVCRENGDWPAYPMAVREIGLPKWFDDDEEF